MIVSSSQSGDHPIDEYIKGWLSTFKLKDASNQVGFLELRGRVIAEINQLFCCKWTTRSRA